MGYCICEGLHRIEGVAAGDAGLRFGQLLLRR
jgi:hypothetical protein